MTAKVCEIDGNYVHCLVQPHSDEPASVERLLEAAAHLRRLQPVDSLWPQCAELSRGVFRTVYLTAPLYRFEKPCEPLLFRALAVKNVADRRYLHLHDDTGLDDDRLPLAESLTSLQLAEAVILYSLLTFTLDGTLVDVFVLIGVVPWFAAPSVSVAVVGKDGDDERIEWRFIIVNSATNKFDPNQLRTSMLLQRAPSFLPLPVAPAAAAASVSDNDDDGDDSQFLSFSRTPLTRRLAKARVNSTRLRGAPTGDTTTTTRSEKRRRVSRRRDDNDDDADGDDETPVTAEEVIVTMFERVDLAVINYLLTHQELIMPPSERSKFRRYAASALRNNGRVPIRYVHRSIKPRWGRLQAIDESNKQASSFQGLKHALSNTLAARYHIQLDITNAHPTLALWLARRMNMTATALALYVGDRERFLLDAGNGDRDVGKAVFIVLMYGGGNPNPNRPLAKVALDFRRELKAVASCIYADNPDLVAAHNAFLTARRIVKNEHQRVFSLFGYYLQNIECEILLLATEFLRNAGWVPCAFKHDGLLLEKRADIAEPSAETLAQLTTLIATKLGIDGIHFKLQSLTDERLALPAELLTTTTTTTP